MNLKRLLLSLLIGGCLCLSGCVFKDTAKDMITSDEVKILGNWYDQESYYYFSFTEDGHYTLGFDPEMPNTGGNYEIKDQKLYLTITQAIVDGNKINVPENEWITTEMNYRFNLNDDLVLDGQHNAFALTRIDPDNPIVKPVITNTLTGLYLSEDGDLAYYFDKNGGVRLSSKVNGYSYEGKYVIKHDTLTITYSNTDLKQEFYFSIEDDGRLGLTSTEGITTVFIYQPN